MLKARSSSISLQRFMNYSRIHLALINKSGFSQARYTFWSVHVLLSGHKDKSNVQRRLARVIRISCMARLHNIINVFRVKLHKVNLLLADAIPRAHCEGLEHILDVSVIICPRKPPFRDEWLWITEISCRMIGCKLCYNNTRLSWT